MRFVEGGDSRQQSVENALASLKPDTDFVAVHDAVRPFIDSELVEKVIAEAARTGAAIVGIVPVDTVKRVHKNKIRDTLPRENLVLAQTPQVFRFDLLKRAKAHLESEHPLREMEMTPEDKKRLRGFMFLSEKPILYVLNVSEAPELGKELENAVGRFKLSEVASRLNAGATAICGRVEAELAEMSDADAGEFLSSYGLKESGLVRLIRTTYALLGLISFFTVGEDECRAWTIPLQTRAVEAAGAIHSDLEKHFIRAETIGWDQLLEAGSEANARAKGTLRLEGKDYIVKDGDVLHIRHSG